MLAPRSDVIAHIMRDLEASYSGGMAGNLASREIARALGTADAAHRRAIHKAAQYLHEEGERGGNSGYTPRQEALRTGLQARLLAADSACRRALSDARRQSTMGQHAGASNEDSGYAEGDATALAEVDDVIEDGGNLD